MQQHGSNYFARRPPIPILTPTLVGSIGQLLQNMIISHIPLKEITKCSNILPASPLPPDPGDVVNRLNSTFQNMVMWHIILKGLTQCSNMVANILTPYTPTHTHTHDPEEGTKGQIGGLRAWSQKVKISTFSEHGHLAYQIKENHECSSIEANILLADPYKPPPIPLTLSLGSGSKGQNSTFSDHGHNSYEIKENLECSSMVANMMPLPPPPPDPGDGVNGSKFNFFTT